MRSLRRLGVATLILTLAAPAAWSAPKTDGIRSGTLPRRGAALIDNTAHMDVNNLDMVVTNHGSFAYDLLTGNAGLIYPKGGTKTAVYAAGLWIGAKVGGATRVAVSEYSQEFTPGPMAGGTFQPDLPSFRSYRIDRGNTTSSDYLNWPVEDGAPVDGLGRPELLGDATIWSVYNDADPGVHTNDAGSTEPLGVEIQQTTFAFNRAGPLGNIIFVRFKILNRGGNTLDSTYVSLWSDPDLGGFTDDLVGCDTTLSLGYCYNATNTDGQYGTRPPAIGYDFFRGPIRDLGGGVLDTLGMVSFNKYINGTDPASATQTYNYMRGLNFDGSAIHENNDPLQPITTYQVSGNPVTSSGWLDTAPADRRLMLSSGPFTMAPGDSQIVYAAIVIGQGTDRLSSIADMKAKDAVAQLVFELLFDIPAPPPAPIVYAQALDRGVRLVWDSAAVGYADTSLALGQEFHFEGYRVWQMSSNSADSDPTVIATYDEGNAVGTIFSDEFNSSSGVVERTLKVAGSNSGLSFSIDIDADQIRGGRLINNKDYYYAVTAYAYDVLNVAPFIVGGASLGDVSEVLESARNVVAVEPRSSSAIFGVDADEIAAGDLNIGGGVQIEQLIQNEITGDLYRVTFEEAESETWTLYNVTDADTLLSGQGSIHGDFDSPVTEGFMVRVTAPRGVAQFGEVQADESIADMLGGVTDSTGTWHLARQGAAGAAPNPNSLSYTLFPGGATSHDFEIRVLPDTTQNCWLYGSGEVSFVAPYKVPFEVWDLGWNSIGDTSDDVKVTVMVRESPDSTLHGRWQWGDVLYVREIPYGSVSWSTAGTKSTDYVPDGSDQTLGRFVFVADDTTVFGAGQLWPDPTRIRFIARRLTAADLYEFRTQPVGSALGSVVGNDLSKVLAVPNPYYAHSQYELTQFDRVMKFTNIPASRSVTLRIFNLAGDLVRTIRREPTTADEMAQATIQWDLNTERNLPVASGVYIYRLDVAGVGSKTDRLAVFFEEERLDNF